MNIDFPRLFEIIQDIDWATISNIAVVVTAVFVLIQLFEARRTTHAQSYSVVREILQEESVRKARKTIFQLSQSGKNIDEWSEDEVEKAEKVCHTYDAVGQMVRHKLISTEIVIESWGPSLRRIWPIVLPLITKLRKDWNSPEVWDDFEWLALEAISKNKSRFAKEKRQDSIRQFSKTFMSRKLMRRRVTKNGKNTNGKH